MWNNATSQRRARVITYSNLWTWFSLASWTLFSALFVVLTLGFALLLVTRQLEMTRGMLAACGVFAVISVMSIRELTWVVSSVATVERTEGGAVFSNVLGMPLFRVTRQDRLKVLPQRRRVRVPNRNGTADHVWHEYVVNEHVAGRSLYVGKDREVLLHDALVVLEPLITPTP